MCKEVPESQIDLHAGEVQAQMEQSNSSVKYLHTDSKCIREQVLMESR